MGVYIRLEILPNEMDPQEWERVYEESLLLLEAYPFLDLLLDEETYRVIWAYVDRARERPLPQVGGKRGWHVFGDEISLQTAESFELVRHLDVYRSRVARAGDTYGKDILATMLPEEWLKLPGVPTGGVMVFDAKTQGYPYHLYVLAVACLIESRFPGKAVVSGDSTRQQMELAVGWANSLLPRPIQLSERTEGRRLLDRIRPLVRDEISALKAWIRLSLLEGEEERGAFIRREFSSSVIERYYLARFQSHQLGTLGFRSVLREFLLQGFSLADACRICVLDPAGCRYDAAVFAESVLQLGWPDAPEQEGYERLSALLEPRGETPETVYSMLGKVILNVAGVREPMRTGFSYSDAVEALEKELGELCDVKALAGQRTEPEKPGKRNAFLEQVGSIMDELSQNAVPGYDIDSVEDLIGWTWEDRIRPSILEKLNQVSAYVTGIGREEYREELERFHAGDQRKRERMLISRCRYYYIHKHAWNYILNLKDRPDQLERVYLLLSVKAEEYSLYHICKALANNTRLLRSFILKEELLH